jgi:hypothetical protein
MTFPAIPKQNGSLCVRNTHHIMYAISRVSAGWRQATPKGFATTAVLAFNCAKMSQILFRNQVKGQGHKSALPFQVSV